MDYKEIGITNTDRIITADELGQIVLSMRRSILEGEDFISRESVQRIICKAVGTAHLLEMCGKEPSEQG